MTIEVLAVAGALVGAIVSVVAGLLMKYIDSDYRRSLMAHLEENEGKEREGMAISGEEHAIASGSEGHAVVEANMHANIAVDTAAAEMTEAAQQILNEARAEAARIVTEARQSAEGESSAAAARAKEALRDQVASLAVAGAEKILKREIDVRIHADILEYVKKNL